MLVISRKPGESMLIGDNIKVTILNVGTDKVTLGIEAPKEVNIIRDELAETIAANRASAEPAKGFDVKEVAQRLKSTTKKEKL